MINHFFKNIVAILLFLGNSHIQGQQEATPAAENLKKYLPLIKNKKIAIIANQTSVVGKHHLVDTLKSLNIDIQCIFAPEHGFRGNHDAGKHVANGKDIRTGLPIISLYGKNKKPTKEQLSGVEVVVFDIQDVGVRFYTYLSTLHYVMEACAENKKQLVILDRPNPNGYYFDGPILKKGFSSFVGLHPIPIVHGCTLGELALMINGEKWLKGGIQCNISVVKNDNYSHKSCYNLPIKPSPNLPNTLSIALYPSLCLFEATTFSVGRGTSFPFQVIGAPFVKDSSFSFTPVSIEGAAKYPKHENTLCLGTSFRNKKLETKFTLKYVIDYVQAYKETNEIISNERFFNLLAGSDVLLRQLKSGLSEDEIQNSWQEDLKQYEKIRKKYLLYD